jgi:hypothetical protein
MLLTGLVQIGGLFFIIWMIFVVNHTYKLTVENHDMLEELTEVMKKLDAVATNTLETID